MSNDFSRRVAKREPPKIIYGRHPVVDAIKSGVDFDKIMLQTGIRGPFEKEVRFLGKTHNIPVQTVPKEKLAKLTKGNHQGIIGFISLIKYHSLEDVLPLIYEKGEIPLILVLDGVTDVRNLGAIARSAECMGVHALVISKKGNAQINADAIKTSAGALATIPVCRSSSLLSAIEFLKMSGIQILASNLGAKSSIFETDLTHPCAIIVGSEGSGVQINLLQEADHQFIIPQVGQTESLNVSVATGMMLLEALRQRSFVEVK